MTVPVFAPRPIAADPVPHHPFMAPNGKNNMHNDPYMTDTYTWSGPNGGTLRVQFGALSGLCPTLTFDASGRLITVGSSVDGTTIIRELLLIAPNTLEVLARHGLPSGAGGGSTFGGGGYIYLDHLDRAVVPTADQRILIFAATDAPAFVRDAAFDLAPTIANAGASIQSALPDWSGRIWWVTDTGLVGYVDPASGQIRMVQLPSSEHIGNSFAIDETGGVFVVSNVAQYRFDVDEVSSQPTATWRYTYDRGSFQKPGQQNFGSGTTPTLLGKSYLGITDNAEPQMHVVVYRREREFAGNRKVGEQPVFAPGQSATENSLIGLGHSFVVENNYGYDGTLTTSTGPVTPGLARVAFGDDPPACSLAWDNPSLVVPSVVSKASLANGLLYTYTLDRTNGQDDWYVTAVDAATGSVAYQVLVGSGLDFDNHYASLFVGPNGIIYVPVWAGIVSVGPA